MERRNWFGHKRFGYGIGPRTWEGWLSILGFAIVLAAGMAVLKFMIGDVPHPWPGLIALAWTAVCTGLFFWIAEGRTEGDMRWRWGGRD